MTRICSENRLNAPVEEVFVYVTTPGNRPKWRPSASGVSGAADHPFGTGDRALRRELHADLHESRTRRSGTVETVSWYGHTRR